MWAISWFGFHVEVMKKSGTIRKETAVYVIARAIRSCKGKDEIPVNHYDTRWSKDIFSGLPRREIQSHLGFAAARLELCSPLPLVDSLDVDPYLGHHGPFIADALDPA
jgi:hypothetical protein